MRAAALAKICVDQTGSTPPGVRPVTIRRAGCPAGLSVVRPSTNHPAEATARMKSAKVSAAPAEWMASIVSRTGCHGMSRSRPTPARNAGAVPLTSGEKRHLAFTAAQAWGADRIFDELFREGRAPGASSVCNQSRVLCVFKAG